MGHLTRSLSLLKTLSQENEIYFFGNQSQIEFLENENIDIQLFEFPEYRLNFSGKSFLAEMLFQSPRMIQDIQIEKSNLTKIHEKEKFDLSISDNRFGFRIKDVPSIILTHQLKIKSPIFEKQGSKLNQIYLNKFDNIWVPDDKKSSLSGELSSVKLDTPITYLGNISDLQNQESSKEFAYFVIGSGPEPYRTDFIHKVLNHFQSTDKKIVITGMKEIPPNTSKNISIVKTMNRTEIQNYINKSETIISRAGYTTILDMDKTKSKAILIPTKNQFEQEYLAKHLKNHPHFTFQNEGDLNIIC